MVTIGRYNVDVLNMNVTKKRQNKTGCVLLLVFFQHRKMRTECLHGHINVGHGLMMGQSGCCEYECFGPCSCPVIVYGSHSAKYGSQNYIVEQRW